MPMLAYKLKKYLEDNDISTVLSMLDRTNVIACYAKKIGWRGKLIISERADPIAYYRSIPLGSLMIGLIKKYYHFADSITVISKGIAYSLNALGLTGSRVIYNPIIRSGQHGGRQPSGGPFTFISIGRLERQKNHELLLRAFARIGDRNCRLVIVGKGELLGRLKKTSVALKIQDRVSFAGFQSDIRGWLNRSDCLVFSSDYEGFGNAIVEALDSGVAVISTDCHYGPREILAPGTDINASLRNDIEIGRYGILTPVKDAARMADAMRRMMNDAALRDGYNRLGPKRAADFDVKKIARQYFELF
jgi:N-acetylgalactosamine-N,N'-diacetylbacillosaminyl-diphospho-undecaprenol 4-alpha-N-acetylgalactosaminyltransferase